MTPVRVPGLAEGSHQDALPLEEDPESTLTAADDTALPITRAELRVVLEFLGLTNRDAAAAILKVHERTLRAWLSGRYPIPAGVADDLERIEAFTADCVGEYVAALQDATDIGVTTYEQDHLLWADRPDLAPYPAAWHRAIIARVAQEIPGLEIVYAGQEHP